MSFANPEPRKSLILFALCLLVICGFMYYCISIVLDTPTEPYTQPDQEYSKGDVVERGCREMCANHGGLWRARMASCRCKDGCLFIVAWAEKKREEKATARR